jgi:ribosomal RNA-processing protein 36
LPTDVETAEKKKLLLKARYDAAAAEGGKRAVKKIVEKKRKKLSQSETKSRPFPRNTNSVVPQPSRKRTVPGKDDGPTKKRQKLA